MASLRRKIYLDVKKTSSAHGFIRLLRDRNRLIRCYTQNIDGLEAREGLCTDMHRGHGSRTRFSRKSAQLPKSPARFLPGGDLDGGCEVVQLHGDLELLRCSFCRSTCRWEEQGREALFLLGEAPACPSCEELVRERRNRGKRGSKIGTLRPNIVLYGEQHPSADIIGKLSVHDLGLAPDVLLILGTSLQVHGLKLLVREFAKSVHAKGRGKGKVILVNLTKPSESIWKDVIDYWVAMDCDEWVDSVRVHRPDLWQSQTELNVQKRKPRSKPVKMKKNRNEETETLNGIKCSNAPSQDDLLEPKRVPSTPKHKYRRDKMIDSKDGKGVVSFESLMATPPKIDDMNNDGVNEPKAKRRSAPNMSLDSGATSSHSRSRKRMRAPLQTILNQSIMPPLDALFAAEPAQIAMTPRETGTVSPYFVKAQPSRLAGDERCHHQQQQQLSPATNKANHTSREPDTNPNPQLMTPPPSGHKKSSSSQNLLAHKRRRAEDTDVDVLTNRPPVKRFKPELYIWHDEDSVHVRTGSLKGRSVR